MYLQKRREYTTPVNQRYYCPIPDCGVFVRVGDNIKDLAYRRQRCSRGHLTCIDCRSWAHKDAVECPKNSDMLGVLRTIAHDEGWRRCHRCNTMIEHQSMCRHMTCRCGAEFCYVCGKVWWTCGCTERQLEAIKRRAREKAAKRKAQENRERREAQELREALEKIAKAETERAVKLVRMRLVKEEQRKRQVRSKYEGYATMMDELNDFQKSFLDGQHQRHQDHLTLRSLEAVTGLRRKHDARINELRAISETKIEEKVKELEQTWLDRIAEDLRAVEDQEESHSIQWSPIHWDETNKAGASATPGLPETRTSGYERRKEEYLKKRADALERMRYVLEEEVAIHDELMEAKKTRIVESFEVQARELRRQIRSQRHWLTLVFAERSRVLEEFMAVELADEILNDEDDRWNTIITKEDLREAGSSRFTRSASDAMQHQAGYIRLSSQTGSDAGPSSPRPEESTREPTPPSWNPLSLGSALHAAWDSTWEAYWHPHREAGAEVSESITEPPEYSPQADPPPPIPPRASARAPEPVEVPVPPTPIATPSERPSTPAPWASLLNAIGDFLLEAPPGAFERRR